MIIRELVMSDEDSLSTLIEKIESALINKEFWLPINDTSRTHFLDKKWTRFYGAFENGELIGASALFLNHHEFGESLSQLDEVTTMPDEVAEIGRAMVLPIYRGKNLLLDINRHVVEEAVRLEKKYLIATIHPDNIPSRKSFEKLGMQKRLTYTKSCGYVRDIYLMKLQTEMTKTNY